MAAPTNISPATAINITTLPYTNTQVVDSGGVTYTVYYKRTAVAGETEYGGWFFGDLSVYKPSVSVVNASDVAIDFGNGGTVVGTANAPIQHPVVPGTTYYYKVITNAGNPSPASLAVSLLLGANATAPIGSPIINDDLHPFPAVVFDFSQDNTPLQFHYPFAVGEHAAIVDDGTSLWVDLVSGRLKLYNNQLGVANSSVTDASGLTGICSNNTDTFYCSFNGTTGYVQKFGSDGSIGAVVASGLPLSSAPIAVSPDETLLYYVVNSTGAIGKWNLTTNVTAGTLAAAIGGKTTSTREILCLKDGKIVVFYGLIASPFTATIKIYNADGTVFATYDLSTSVASGSDQRLGTAEDDPTYFVIYCSITPNPAQNARYIQKIKVSDGSALKSIVVRDFFNGVSKQVPANSMIRFGKAGSCPIIVTRTSIVPPVSNPPGTEGSGIYFFNPGKQEDSLYKSISGSPPTNVTSKKVAINNPFVIQPVIYE